MRAQLEKPPRGPFYTGLCKNIQLILAYRGIEADNEHQGAACDVQQVIKHVAQKIRQKWLARANFRQKPVAVGTESPHRESGVCSTDDHRYEECSLQHGDLPDGHIQAAVAHYARTQIGDGYW